MYLVKAHPSNPHRAANGGWLVVFKGRQLNQSGALGAGSPMVVVHSVNRHTTAHQLAKTLNDKHTAIGVAAYTAERHAP